MTIFTQIFFKNLKENNMKNFIFVIIVVFSLLLLSFKIEAKSSSEILENNKEIYSLTEILNSANVQKAGESFHKSIYTTATFTINNSTPLAGYKIWNGVHQSLQVILYNSPANSNYSVWLVTPTGQLILVSGNQSVTNYNNPDFFFDMNSTLPNRYGYSIKICAQGHPEIVWVQSELFSISRTPELTMSVSPTDLHPGDTARVSWTFSGGIEGYRYGGIDSMSYLQIQWYQNNLPLSVLAFRQIYTGYYDFTVPDNIGTIPGTFVLSGSNQGGGIPYGRVWNYSPAFTITPVITGIHEVNSGIPKEFKLYSAYPNPFNPTSKVNYDLPHITDVKIIVYNAQGKEVASEFKNHVAAGTYSYDFDGAGKSSGVYFCRIVTDQFTDAVKLVLTK